MSLCVRLGRCIEKNSEVEEAKGIRTSLQGKVTL